MKAKKSVVIVLIITLSTALLTVGEGLTNANNDPIEPWAPCNPAGSYYGNHPVEPVAAALTVVPNDPECRSISCIQKIFYMDHTLGGAFPDLACGMDGGPAHTELKRGIDVQGLCRGTGDEDDSGGSPDHGSW